MIAMVKSHENRDDDRFPNRKSPRLKDFDYATPNSYFITVCTFDKKCIFWRDGVLNEFGTMVFQGIMEIPKHFPNNPVEKFVVMPNHLHMILTVEPGGASVSTVVGALKSHVTKQIHEICPEIKVWQASFHDHGIRGQKDYDRIWEYIENNPLRWNEDCFYTES